MVWSTRQVTDGPIRSTLRPGREAQAGSLGLLGAVGIGVAAVGLIVGLLGWGVERLAAGAFDQARGDNATRPAGDQQAVRGAARQPIPRQVPAWTTSRIRGSPDPPPPYRPVRIGQKLQFNKPLLIARSPLAEQRLYIGEERGAIYAVTWPAPGMEPRKELVLDLRTAWARQQLQPDERAEGIGALYGLAFHPRFAENRYCFVCYTLVPKKPQGEQFADGTRVSRFRLASVDPPRIDPTSEEIILTFVGGGHNGGDLHFGPDGMLYISTGDAAGPNPPDPLNTGQDCSDLLASILRIDVDRQEAGRRYAIPPDNPFVGQPGIRGEIWAYGFRNPWRMSFDRKTGELWVGDVGWELWEMVHKVEKGGNYGWSIVEGRQPIKPEQKPGPTPIRPPVIELPHTVAASVTGGYVYRGKKFPELQGAYIFGDWETRRLWAARLADGRVREMPELVKPSVRIVAFGEDAAGELYFLDYDTGYLYTLERNSGQAANQHFPTTLSATGLFEDVGRYRLAPGVISFAPNARQWLDGAEAQWHIALPGTSQVRQFEQPRPLPGQVYWHSFHMQFPADAVLVKTVSIRTPQGLKRLETQILHYDGEDWRGYSYWWRDDQSDADLVPAEGLEKTLTVPDPLVLGGQRQWLWQVPSRAQCLACHNVWAEFTLAFNLPQLNGPGCVSPSTWPNQLLALQRLGVIQRVDPQDQPLPPWSEATARRSPALVDPYDDRYSLEQRARSYLHVNCAHCHRFGGGGGQVVLELDISKPLGETGIYDTRPRQGDFGLSDARLLAPGAPGRSVLLYRVAKFGRGRMPHWGSEWPDRAGIELLCDWICALGQQPPLSPDRDPTGLETKLRRFPDTLRWLRGPHTPDQWQRLLTAAQRLDPGPIRDLFDGYFPPDPAGRKLGPHPKPQTILALRGDPQRGQQLFRQPDLKCLNCHKHGSQGTDLGPELTHIGRLRSRSELLESLLEPSRVIEPRYAAYLVRTHDERQYTGLLIQRTADVLILRDAENKELRLAAADVASVTPARLSLMPDGLLASLTAQQAADLLEFLVQSR
ncbi:MAG: PQQ-dependent sugar dehydrogenase [Gemmataceae bacterium]|nr:PQQ-dependent sugar dehydrogenase [Gemmataceae bacterium]